MVNVAALVREFLLAQASVVAVLGTNEHSSIYAAPDLPERFDPKKGACIQLVRSGGIPPIEIPQLLTARLQVRVWTDQEQYLQASDVYGALRDVLHGAANAALDEGMLLSALEVTGPQEMTDPETAWVSVNSFYTIMARPN
jgi:hypothetical protein